MPLFIPPRPIAGNATQLTLNNRSSTEGILYPDFEGNDPAPSANHPGATKTKGHSFFDQAAAGTRRGALIHGIYMDRADDIVGVRPLWLIDDFSDDTLWFRGTPGDGTGVFVGPINMWMPDGFTVQNGTTTAGTLSIFYSPIIYQDPEV